MCWAICEGVPFCLATDKIRPANDAQCLAYQYLHGGEDRLPPEEQQSFIDNRTVPDVDEQGDLMPHDGDSPHGDDLQADVYSPDEPAEEEEISNPEFEDHYVEAPVSRVIPKRPMRLKLDDYPREALKKKRIESNIESISTEARGANS